MSLCELINSPCVITFGISNTGLVPVFFCFVLITRVWVIMSGEVSFSVALLNWYQKSKRPLPWRVTPSIYSTWISEVMSQQTTLAVVVPRFQEFVKQFPTLTDFYLASCGSEDALRQVWQGLGYYARARNFIRGVRYVIEELKGQYPCSYSDWLLVPGVGPYTASVLASVHSNEAKVCLDGNVTRVVARVHALKKVEDVWTPAAQDSVRQRAQVWMDQLVPRFQSHAGDLNQALMELGATVCTKANPRCESCPVSFSCQSLKELSLLQCPPPKPRKEKVPVEVTAWLLETESTAVKDCCYFILERSGRFLKKTIGFPLSDNLSTEPPSPLPTLLRASTPVARANPIGRHTITHHAIELNVKRLRVSESQVLESLKTHSDPIRGRFVSIDELSSEVSSSLDVKVLKWLLRAPTLGS